VTDAALPPDRPATDHCGSCSACLQACPTGALAAPGWLDCARCISYLTIEHRARFGPRQARAVGLHLFGCDICQAVCPWNVKMRSRCSSALAARAHLNDPPLAVLRRLDSAGWASFSAGSPLRRLSFARFRRNLAAVTRNAEADLPLEDA
jgi:epoxyqueuosine reductase